MSEETQINEAVQHEEKKPATTASGGNASNNNTFAKADEKLIEFVSMYTHGLINKMEALAGKMTALWISLVVLALVLVGASLHMYLTMQELKTEAAKQYQLIERMDKRHWELSKVIELSQERSARKKAETGNGKEPTTLP